MCGRYTLFTTEGLEDRFGVGLDGLELQPNYNVAPGQTMPVIVRHGKNELEMMRWGLVPFWAKDEKIGYKMINARAETLQEKPAFRAAFKSRRCLVPASGYYEWLKEGASKTPYLFTLKGEKVFSLAGLYETWTDPQGMQLATYTIITTEPNALAAKVHDRMPAILLPEEEAEWLDNEAVDTVRVTRLLGPFSEDRMESYPVSTAVGDPSNNELTLINPLKHD